MITLYYTGTKKLFLKFALNENVGTPQEYGLPLLAMTATELVGGISGDSEANIRELFLQAAVSCWIVVCMSFSLIIVWLYSYFFLKKPQGCCYSLIPLFSGNAEISCFWKICWNIWLIENGNPSPLDHQNYRFSAVFALAWWKDCRKLF